MFATLVIQLPSDYSGGHLAVYHQSETKTFNFSGAAGRTSFHYSAFYADCQHEIKPVTKGYRLCLVYNLVYTGPGDSPAPSDNQKVVSKFVSSMKEWTEAADAEYPLMAYMLQHKYSRAGLSFKSLKNSDRAVADILTLAKREVQFDLFVANIHLEENWSAYGWDKYDYEEDSINEESATAEKLKSTDGICLQNSISLEKEYFVPEDFFCGRDPDKNKIEATGNEGVTVDKQYNWAAILIWPSKYRMKNLGITNLMDYLGKLHLKKGQDMNELEAIAQQILLSSNLSFLSADLSVSLLRVFVSIGKLDPILKFFEKISYSRLIESSSFSDQAIAIGLKYGWDILKPHLQAIFNNLSSSNSMESYVQFLYKISEKPSEVQKCICQDLAEVVVRVLSNEEDATSFSLYGRSKCIGKECIILLFKCLTNIQSSEQLLITLMKALIAKPNRYPIMGTLAPACESLKSLIEKEDNRIINQLLSHCISSLAASCSDELPAPVNWSQPVTLACFCEDCQSLVRFFSSPTETVGRFKVGKQRRTHLARQIKERKCSASVTNERVGSRHCVVVTKNHTSYEEEKLKHHEKRAILSRLKSIKAVMPTQQAVVAEPSVKRQKVEL